jgi:hypothetical protein
MLCAGTIACSSTDESGEPSEEPTGTGGGGNVENGLPDPNGGLEWPAGHSEPCANPLDTGYMNDELCLEPPAPDVGFQVHFGPSDYDDPVEMSNFLLQPGAENVVCQFRHTPDFEGVRYSNEQHTRLRSGTHHYIMWSASVDDAGLSSPPPPDGTYSDDSCQNPFEYLFTTGSQAALSEQGGILDIRCMIAVATLFCGCFAVVCALFRGWLSAVCDAPTRCERRARAHTWRARSRSDPGRAAPTSVYSYSYKAAERIQRKNDATGKREKMPVLAG